MSPVRYPARCSQVAIVDRSTPNRYAASKPPFVPPLDSTPVLCAYCPRRIVVRDGQHNETLTIARVKRMPCAPMVRSTPGIACRSARVMSSASTNRMFGRLVARLGATAWVRAPAGAAASTTATSSRTTTGSARRRTGTEGGDTAGHCAAPVGRFPVMATETQRWRVGDTTITSVVEDEIAHIPPEFFFPAATAAAVATHPWVLDDYADPDGNITLRVQALVVETGSRRVLVDPCVGNFKDLLLPFWANQEWPFMERFTDAGFSPAGIDTVVHTHVHADHIGW